ncbi:MAG: hypothetical protein IKV70_06425 [Phascolarctobacterium sp.]|nr:hypothetical protein [Clostridia bacterium]MBR5487588.1 hypothetical protein [Phascolarctobacterium sp.]
MRNNALYFLEGERKYVQFAIHSSKSQKVVVTQANYELTQKGEVVESGSCEIVDGATLQILLEVSKAGNYELEVTYMVAPEIRKARCTVNVY